MKALLSLLAMLFAFQFSYAQTNAVQDTTAIGLGATSTDPSYKFIYGGKSVAHYGLGWYTDSDFAAPMTYLSGYGGLKFFTEGSARLYIDASGNVGIGTTSPASKLDVAGSINLATGNNITWGGAYGAGIPTIAANSSGIYFYPAGSTSGESMRINSSGNVGVGTATIPTGYKMAVNGNIIAAGVQILPNGSWPDYVFKPQYRLPSLTDIKIYIDQNQHLPDMPSEQEVAKNGVNLGEIVKLQTKKIEELTLYLIEMKDQKEEQTAINKKLENEIQDLKAQFKALKN